VFVVVYVVKPELWPPLAASLGLALVLALVRLIGGSSVMGAVSGLAGIALGVVWALVSGEPEGFFVPGLWLNAGYLAACLLSIAVGTPLVAVVCAVAAGRLAGLRQDKALLRRGAAATWVLAAMFALRLAAQVPLYLAGQVAALGTVKLAMGVPVFAATWWVPWQIRRPVWRPRARAPPGPDQADADSE
jgi:hypothetical protein